MGFHTVCGWDVTTAYVTKVSGAKAAFLPSFLPSRFCFSFSTKIQLAPLFSYCLALSFALDSCCCIAFSISAKETETTPNKGSFPRNLISRNFHFLVLVLFFFFLKLCSSHGSGIRQLFSQFSKVFDFRFSLLPIAAKEFSFAALCSCFCNRQVVPLFD